MGDMPSPYSLPPLQPEGGGRGRGGVYLLRMQALRPPPPRTRPRQRQCLLLHTRLRLVGFRVQGLGVSGWS